MDTNGHEFLRRNPCRFVLTSVKILEPCASFPERGYVSRNTSPIITRLSRRSRCGLQTRVPLRLRLRRAAFIPVSRFPPALRRRLAVVGR